MNIRNTLVATAAALTLSAIAGGAFAGTVSSTANASVIVVSPTTLTKLADMNFGTVVKPNTTNNTITLGTNDAVSISGTGNGALMASTTTAAKFSLATVAAITSYTTTQTLTFLPAGNLINVSASAPAIISGPTGAGLAAGGSQTLAFGGQFDITPSTVAQTYTGTLSVTVNYN